MLDIHSHILPQIDDGAKTIEQSILLLEKLKEQGCTHVLLTPHFYAQNTDIAEFKELFDEKFEELKNAVKDMDLPVLLPGCEVYYFTGIATCADLGALTLNGSKYLLLELPEVLSPEILDAIIDLNLNCGFVPIIAHVERYKKSKYYGNLLEFVEKGFILSHINASSFKKRSSANDCYTLIKNDLVTFIASDVHNLKRRPAYFTKAFKKIEKKLGEQCRTNFINNSIALLKKIGIDSIE